VRIAQDEPYYLIPAKFVYVFQNRSHFKNNFSNTMDNLKNSVNVREAVPFFMVTNMDSSLNFYVQGLGFELKNKWEPRGKIEWCLLQLDSASIMLQEYRQDVPAEKLGEGVSIYFICEDALTIYDRIVSQGLSPSEPFVGNNMWVVGMKDPNGYNIFFENTTDVPEGTRYSDWIKTMPG
jgi:lactoylglutathione lyase